MRRRRAVPPVYSHRTPVERGELRQTLENRLQLEARRGAQEALKLRTTHDSQDSSSKGDSIADQRAGTAAGTYFSSAMTFTGTVRPLASDTFSGPPVRESTNSTFTVRGRFTSASMLDW